MASSPPRRQLWQTGRAGLPARADFAYSSALMTKPQPPARLIIRTNDLCVKEIENTFRAGTAPEFIPASRFYQLSTQRQQNDAQPRTQARPTTDG